MNKWVEHNEREESLARETNIDITMIVLYPIIWLYHQLHSGIKALLLRYQRKIIEESFKIVLPVFITLMVIKIMKSRDSRIHFPFNFLWIIISMNILTIKIKSHKENFSA